ncbi:endonuclease/exonuclease/phosphatase family protein [Ruminococcaceae bacterium OttesenSCG-928-A16]|nr:endonuclease/exonuclease/phosphatase family protein [Ruminococcaceae bacterium OttesenSCG-928-A16]
MNKVVKRILITVLSIVALLALVVGGYVLYIVLQYSRIPDFTPLTVENQQQAQMQAGQPYTALTYNIGFGAYNTDFSFFMDSGVMNDGTEVTGAHARAQSAQIVQTNTQGAIAQLAALNPDFCLLQEVDVKATRSWEIDQSEAITTALPGYSSAYASNFHSAYLAYPFHEPHGAVEAGLLTLSRYNNTSTVRRSYPVDNSFPTKFFDLDRCFVVQRLPVEGGGELVLINSHMSAYDEGGLIRAAQLEMLANTLQEERAKGNWVIVGGDFNHALGGTAQAFPSQQQVPSWVSVFNDADLPEGFSVVLANNLTSVSTCRSSDLPYVKGVNYEVVVDGFIVSDNITATASNIDTSYEFSDHNPVLLQFSLNPPTPVEEAPAG